MRTPATSKRAHICPAYPDKSRHQSASNGHFQRRFVRVGIRLDAQQNGPGVFPIYSCRDLVAFEFDNPPKNKLRIIEFFCWTRTGLFDTVGTLLGKNFEKNNNL
jgi:hypothetical protein